MPYLLVALMLFAIPFASLAADAPTVTITRPTGITTFTPFANANETIGGVTVHDLGSDNTAEILLGAGPGMPPSVAVFRQDGSRIGTFLAYDAAFTGGVNVAACDVDGDGASEIITGARFGGGPHVRIFDNMGNAKYPGFFAYDATFRGGVSVACGDVDGDGQDDIVTGPGLSGGPHLKVFSVTGDLKYEVFNGSATLNTGSYVRIAPDGTIAAAPIGLADETLTYFAVHDDALVATTTTSVESRALYFSTAASNDVTVTADVAPALFAHTDPQYIAVDISEQRMFVYEHGILISSFLVSTGVYGYDTPLGSTSITAKLPVHDYSWYYGAGDARNYSLPNVQWNLRFRPHYYIHSAYWHNNFGHRMSHGCVNMSIPDAEWVYNWANIGTTVEITP